tara:strand:+ start:970 stop:1248 length:279 start_codon:yes stop_codon:yes gene_type:complete
MSQENYDIAIGDIVTWDSNIVGDSLRGKNVWYGIVIDFMHPFDLQEGPTDDNQIIIYWLKKPKQYDRKSASHDVTYHHMSQLGGRKLLQKIC